MSNKPLKWVAAVLTLALLAGACSNNNSKSTTPDKNGGSGTVNTDNDGGLFPQDMLNQPVHEGTPKRGGTMTFGVESDILDISPNQKPIQPADVQIAYAAFDPLITYGAADDETWKGKPVTDNSDHVYNQIGEKIEHSDDLKTWTLTLRDGVKFSNGEAFTAQQVVDHTKWIMADTGGNCSCDADARNIADVTAPGPLTVVYTLKEGVVDFPGKLNGGGLGWITESGARAGVEPGAAPAMDQLVGAGPFAYQSKSGDDYTLVANEHYYGVDVKNDDAKLPYLDKIVFKPLADSVTRTQAVQSNGVQIMGTADTSNLVSAKNDPKLNVQPSEGSSATILVLKLTQTPFGVDGENDQETAIKGLKDPTALKARQAFNYSINRNEINQKYYKGTRVPAYGFLPASSPWFDEDGQLPRYDAAKAKSLLDEVKAAGVNTDINAMCINTPEATGIFQILKDQADAVGVKATLNQVEQSVLVNNLLAGSGDIDWNVACFRSPQIADPNGFYNALISGGNTNLVKYSRPEVDEMLNAARATTDVAKRKELYNKIQTQAAADVVYVPLLFDYWGNVFRNDVSGLTTPEASSLGIIRPGNLFYTE